MKIGVSGASGHLGAATIAYLKGRGPAAQIVGVSRTPEKVAALGVEARAGDFDEPECLASAFAGLDRLLIIPTTDMRPGARAIQGRTAIEQAVKAGVGHVVLMSALGTRAACGAAPGDDLRSEVSVFLLAARRRRLPTRAMRERRGSRSRALSA
jgi:NAD(P)H dehydrogenase (quinone)